MGSGKDGGGGRKRGRGSERVGKGKASPEDHRCAICLDEITGDLGVLPCGHAFCFVCISTWATEGATACPTCRKAFRSVEKIFADDDAEEKKTRETVYFAARPEEVPDHDSAGDITDDEAYMNADEPIQDVVLDDDEPIQGVVQEAGPAAMGPRPQFLQPLGRVLGDSDDDIDDEYPINRIALEQAQEQMENNREARRAFISSLSALGEYMASSSRAGGASSSSFGAGGGSSSSGTGGGSSSSGTGGGSSSSGTGGASSSSSGAGGTFGPGWATPAPSTGASMMPVSRRSAVRTPGARITVEEFNARAAAARGEPVGREAPVLMLGARPGPPRPNNIDLPRPERPPQAAPAGGWVLDGIAAQAPIARQGRGGGLTPGNAPVPVGDEPFPLAWLDWVPVLDMPPLPVDAPVVAPVPVVAEGRAVPTAAAAAAFAAAIAE